ncbi:ARM REPEAT PROTEIN INTERACTING WITH ABF2 [Holothuria leucospilota]|uniref:ARM REPEAT PROTEIN INTERACTING WITH ABF2 n=1 Tax=Holothuria leucospilota TaxID=206669 RepID=A0A9Q1C3S2_HOLLE|nr:ARM REPEAT PROTEIN INTERACTING WITH ABF2 [Holothuria leucospilota]
MTAGTSLTGLFLNKQKQMSTCFPLEQRMRCIFDNMAGVDSKSGFTPIYDVEAGFHGTWKIVKVEVYSTEANNVGGLEGVEFHLSESGDIFWKLPQNAAHVPYIVSAFDFYRVTGTKFHFLRFIGGQSGEWFDFNAMFKWEDRMHLKHENVFTIICEKVCSIDKAKEEPYSLISALEEGFFSDITIKAANGKKFLLHRTILQASCPRLHWLRTPPPLTGTEEDVLQIVLHFMYAECLPTEVSSESVQGCMKLASKTAGLERLANMCKEYLKKAALKEQIFTLINELHSCADRVISIFSSSSVSGDTSKVEDNLVSEPAKLCFAVKQAAREAAVAGAKCVLICDLFSRRKHDLSRQERHEIIKYAKSRIPIFLQQLKTFLEAFYEKLRDIFTDKVTSEHRHEVAAYLVPEIKACVDLITRLMEDSRQSLKEVLRTTSSKEKQKKNNSGDYLHRTVQAAMHVEELLKLRSMQGKVSEVLLILQHRKELYEALPEEEKVYALMKLMEQMLEEIPMALEKASRMSEIYGNLSMRKWKFYFKMATSKVAWGLQKASANKSYLQPVVNKCCELVHRDAFSQTISSLGLLEPSTTKAGTSCGTPPEEKDRLGGDVHKFWGLESLKTPPTPGESRLARMLLDLFESGDDTDMIFEIIYVKEEPADIIVDHTKGTPVETQSSERVEEVRILKAHRAIIAARCDWFRRALLSGMRESIDKKIEVHDIDPDLFVQFVRYLYSGLLDTTNMNIEQLADMMAVSDRYEMDNLKQLCECSLMAHKLDNESVLFLLSISDQFNACTLRDACFKYIMEHPLAVESEDFDELPENLQNEVTKLITRNSGRDCLNPVHRYKGLQYDTDSSDSSDYDQEVQGLAAGLMDLRTGPQIVPNKFGSNSGSSDEDPVQESIHIDMARLEETVQQLKEVLGEEIPVEELRRLARAADFDVNRAINFFFSSDS